MFLTPRPIALAAGALLALGGCAPLVPQLPKPLPLASITTEAAPQADGSNRVGTRVSTGPRAPEIEAPKLAVTAPVSQPQDEVVAAVNLAQVALPTFIQVVYADVLKKNVSVDPAVIARPDLVTFKTGNGQTAAQVETAVRLLLKSYGLSVIEAGGLVRVVPDNANLGDLPGIRYGAALPEVPASLRPIFQLIPLESVRQVDVGNWLRTLFGDRVKVQEDSTRNAVLISGNPDNVKAAVEALAVLDQPALKGRTSLTLTPAFSSADELARRLAEVLAAEGYAVHPVGSPVSHGGIRNPIILLPVSSLNQVFVFAAGEKVAAHVAEWARTLDKPNERGIGKNLFTYAVKHKDAEQLAFTLERVLGGGGTVASTPASTAGGASTAATPAASASGRTSVVVDKATNTLIFQVNPEEFGQISALLQSLDKPTKSALIEVTVAELKLDNNAQLGVQWLTDHVQANGGGYKVSAGSSSGGTGFNFSILNGAGAARIAIDALANDTRATILSSPRLMARNGETALIQVGDEVPVLSSQIGTNTGTGGTAGQLLATYQYRSTGVILKIKPVIHSGDQIDLDISQEVSQPLSSAAGSGTTPTISTRKVETKLTLRNGSTMLLAGLIDGTASDVGSGVPFLKDIPLLGNLFKSQVVKKSRREMIILITPYIANDSVEAEAITESFRKTLGDWARMPAADKGSDTPKP
ncbi:general secretion pathway protein D [Pelomonas saccharophila]|uniref:General secretion pathway protein D n=2 Tax=Roseateles saccharophilus TaxID=304 RepID=A0ABU1YSM9_ROSSA|nr:general secretion pathway protein D [Roseateles saccharophilus]